MAQTTSSLRFVCRSCRRKSSSIRTFTSSPAWSKALPTFSQPSSEELSTLLTTWREEVFKPSALSAHHRNLVYKKSRHHMLLNDPGVTVTLTSSNVKDGEEETTLMPKDFFARPNKHRSLQKVAAILGSSRDATDWENLAPFLESMRMAGQKVPVAWLEKIVRKASEMGMGSVVKRCAEQVNRTGMKLAYPGIAREMMLGQHIRAAEARFRAPTVTYALDFAKNLALLMEKEDHCGGKLKEDEVDMRRDPMIMGTILELEAARALSITDGRDVDGQVTIWAQRLVAMSQNTPLEPHDSAVVGRTTIYLLPVVNGIRLALRVSGLGSSNGDIEMKLKTQLKTILDSTNDRMSKDIAAVRAEASSSGKSRRALQLWEVTENAQI